MPKMKSAATKPPEAREKHFDFQTIRATLEGLLFNVERDLKRRTSEASSGPAARGFILMRIAALFSRQAFDAMRFLCADEPAPGRRPEYVFVVPSITRSLLEVLFTIIYVGEDFPARADWFQKAGWREHWEERRKYLNEYSKKPEWKTFFKEFDKALQIGVTELGITPEEVKHPETIKYFPIGARFVKNMGSKNRSFVKWLERWLYEETSAIAHFTPLGVMKFGFFLVRDLASEKDREFLETVTMPKFRSFHMMMAAIVVTAISSELEYLFQLKNRDQIIKIWEALRVDFPDAEDICKRRYDAMLNSL